MNSTETKIEINRKRRSFIVKACAALTGFALKPFRLSAQTPEVDLPSKSSAFPDLVGVKGGSPAQMFEIGIEALGGMERFVSKGDTVLVKPNIGWNRSPSEGANTHPDLVGQIVKTAYRAGAKKVYVFDNTCNRMEDCYRNSGIEQAVRKNKGIMKPGDKVKYYRQADISGAKLLKQALVHELYLDANVVINVPVLKNHVSTSMTSAVKNLMGVVWDRRWWHREGLHQCIADFPLLRKVDLNVIDAYTVMIKNGPRGISPSDLEIRKLQILSPDILLADAAAAKVLSADPADIKYLTMGEQLGYGSINLDDAKIKRVSCSA